LINIRARRVMLCYVIYSLKQCASVATVANEKWLGKVMNFSLYMSF